MGMAGLDLSKVVGEGHHESKHIGARKKLFDQAAGDDSESLAMGQLATRDAVQVSPRQRGEHDGHRQPGRHPATGFLDGHAVRLDSALDEQGQCQHREHEGDETGPHRAGGEDSMFMR